jgi:hypothetical protein
MSHREKTAAPTLDWVFFPHMFISPRWERVKWMELLQVESGDSEAGRQGNVL